MEKLAATQRLLELPEQMLIKHIDVRWNSLYDMLIRFVTNRSAINTFINPTRTVRRNGAEVKESYPEFLQEDWNLMES